VSRWSNDLSILLPCGDILLPCDDMNDFVHQRHQAPTPLERPRELVIVLPPMRSRVNLSRIVRAAGCFGVRRIVACGNPKVDPTIARNATEQVTVESRRSLVPALRELRIDGYQLVGLEQATGSRLLYEFTFDRRTALVIGSERHGIEASVLEVLDSVVEIPVHGMPHSHNAATATMLATYEYCRQFPSG